MKINLADIQWHDSRIKSIILDGQKSSFDTISLLLEGESFLEQFGQREIRIDFRDCFKVKINLQLWITRLDIIKSVEFVNESAWIEEEKKAFKKGFGPTFLKHLVIKTNTNSTIELLLTNSEAFEVKL